MTKLGILALCLVAAASVARADCAEDAKAAKLRVEQETEAARKEEAAKLLEKADRDFRAGRVWLCADAVKRVNALLK